MQCFTTHITETHEKLTMGSNLYHDIHFRKSQLEIHLELEERKCA